MALSVKRNFLFSSSELSPSLLVCPIVRLFAADRSSTFASNASHLPTFSSSALIFTSFISLSTKKTPIYIFSC